MFATVNNRRINYEFINQNQKDSCKPVLVFLHEGLGSIRQWLDFSQLLCNRVGLCGLIYDRYGYGHSDQMETPQTVNFMHEEALIFLPELLEKLEIKNKLILIGHSDGASIALIYASVYSYRLYGVVSEAAHVVIEDISRKGIQKMQNNYLKSRSLRKLFSMYHGEKADNLVFNWTNTLLSDDFKLWNIEKMLHTITVPVLAIQGDLDEYGSCYQLELIKKNIPSKVDVLFLENCGHIPHLQAHEKTLTAIEQFINMNL